MSDLKASLSTKPRIQWNNFIIPIVFVVLFIVATIMGWPNFHKVQNLINVFRQVSYTGIIALGMTFVIISGGIDLSVGSMAAFVGGITIFLVNTFVPESQIGVIVAVLFALVFGALCGAINGVVITKGRVTPFIATLGLMSIYRSLIVYFSQAGNMVSVSVVYPEIGSGVVLGIPVPVWCFVIVAIVLHVLLRNMKFGRHAMAVGANEQVARYSAINVDLTRTIPYIITGATVGLAALLWSSRLNSLNSSEGFGWELDAIAAVVIGGTAMTGGKGSIFGTVLGALMLGIINNMLVLAGVSSYLQGAAKGLIIIAAVLLQYKNKQ